MHKKPIATLPVLAEDGISRFSEAGEPLVTEAGATLADAGWQEVRHHHTDAARAGAGVVAQGAAEGVESG